MPDLSEEDRRRAHVGAKATIAPAARTDSRRPSPAETTRDQGWSRLEVPQSFREAIPLLSPYSTSSDPVASPTTFGEDSKAVRRSGVVVAVIAVLVLLTPYATRWLAFGESLRYQAVVILAATGVLLLWGLGRPGWLQRWRRSPGAVLVGLGLYIAAAALGSLVGVFSGWSLGRIAGQALSMGLLPLAALAGLALERPMRRRPTGSQPQSQFGSSSALAWLAPAVVTAVTGAAMAHLVNAAARLSSGQPVGRLYFSNSVSIAGASLLALLLLLALLHRSPRRPNRRPIRRPSESRWRPRSCWRFFQGLGVLAVVVLGAYLLGAGIRGLFLVTPLATVLFLALAAPRLRWWRGIVLLGLLALALFAAERALWRWETAPRSNLMPGRDAFHLLPKDAEGESMVPPGVAIETAYWTGGKHRKALGWNLPPEDEVWRLPQTISVTEPGLYRMTVHLKRSMAPLESSTGGASSVPASEAAEGCVSLWWLNEERALLGLLTACAEPGLGWRERSVTGLVPEGTVQARIVFHGQDPAGASRTLAPAGASPRWALQRLELERLGDVVTGRVLEQLAFMTRRLRSSLDPFSLGSRVMRGSAAYRLEESRTLIYGFLEAPWHRKLLGHGLGASYALRSSKSVPHSSRLDTEDLNYIHNFYLFLLFKLGLVGTVAVLGALLLWIGWLGKSCLQTPTSPRRTMLAALTAAWAGYALWSAASPELINFRLAPLWGLTLALGVALASEPGWAEANAEESAEDDPP